MDYYEEIDLLEDDFLACEDAVEKYRIAKKMVSLSDKLDDKETQYYAREYLLESAFFSGKLNDALLAFTWCRKEVQLNPHVHNEEMLLWYYKWIITGISDYPTISLDQINDLATEFKERIDSIGYGYQAYYYSLMFVSKDTGDLERADVYYKKAQQYERDSLSDCPACMCDDEVTFLIKQNKLEEALVKAKPIFSGKLSCAEVPHITYGQLILPLLFAGKLEKSEELVDKTFSLIKNNPSFVKELGYIISFYVSTGKYDKALELFENHADWFMSSHQVARKIEFTKACWLLFEKCTGEFSFSLNSKLPFYQESGQYKSEELYSFFKETTLNWEEQFNKRNGNTYVTEVREQEFSNLRN